MSPRVTSAEEPDGGNLLVRIWRGAGMGNLPAYSTKPFFAPASEDRRAILRLLANWLLAPLRCMPGAWGAN